MSEGIENDFLFDILESSRRVLSYQDSVIRNIEIIGEAVKNLSVDLRTKHYQVSWKSIAGMRDRLFMGTLE